VAGVGYSLYQLPIIYFNIEIKQLNKVKQIKIKQSTLKREKVISKFIVVYSLLLAEDMRLLVLC